MNTLERMEAQLLLGIQADAIGYWLNHQDHGLTAEKEANWRKLLETLQKVSVCFHDLDVDLNETKNALGEHRMRVLEDAERIGALKADLQSKQDENTRLKQSLATALELLESNNINTFRIWHS